MSQLRGHRARTPRLAPLLAVLALGGSALALPARGAETVVVTLDQARTMRLPDGTQTLVVGNPAMADVTMLKASHTVVITGKGFGETNMIALDGAGAPLAESVIRVVAPGGALVVQRGMDRETYQCAPRCQPVVNLGDTSKYIGEVSSQIAARNALNAPGGATK